MQLNVSPEIGGILEKAVAQSVHQGQFFVGVDQVFAAILDTSELLPPRFRDQYLNTLFTVMRESARTAWRAPVPIATAEIYHTPRVINALNASTKIASRLGRGSARAGHLLLAILSDGLSAPGRAMDRLKLDREACIQNLRAELSGAAAGAHAPHAAAAAAAAPARERQAGAPVNAEAAPHAAPKDNGGGLAHLTRDLTALAKLGKLEAAVGRDKEMVEILQVLTRKTKNNVILVGEAGVGKTQVVEGLARKLAQKEGKNGLPSYRILELNIAAMMSGTQYRGAFEEKMLALLEQLKSSPDLVLFIDEIHLIMGAGSTDGDGLDMANLLKPALARGEIRCVGATTLQEYRKFVQKDPAIERRFQMVRLEELSEEATLKVLERLRPSLEKHHGVKIGGRAMAAAVKLTSRYMPNQRLPDKAIDVLDQACSRHRLKALALLSGPELSTLDTPGCAPLNKVTPHCVRKVVSQVTAIPLEEITAQERLLLNDLDRRIRSRLIGQDEAVGKVVAAVKKSRAGLADPNRPDAVMLFLGPSGVGKTQLAKLLAENVFGSRNHLITFDMSEYIEEHSVSRLLGAPPGYIGADEEGRLTGAVRNTPFCILLFDEVEKAHPRIFDIFLPVFDEGRLKDSRGRDVSFRNTIIILTSNIGAELLSRAHGDDAQTPLLDELRRHFRPEFINRIDTIVPFYPLLAEDIRTVLKLEIDALRRRLNEKRIGVRMYQRAYEHLGALGYSPDFGARELRRIVDRCVTTPISELIVSGMIEEGDMVDVLVEDDQLVVRKGAPRDAPEPAAS